MSDREDEPAGAKIRPTYPYPDMGNQAVLRLLEQLIATHRSDHRLDTVLAGNAGLKTDIAALRALLGSFVPTLQAIGNGLGLLTRAIEDLATFETHTSAVLDDVVKQQAAMEAPLLRLLQQMTNPAKIFADFGRSTHRIQPVPDHPGP